MQRCVNTENEGRITLKCHKGTSFLLIGKIKIMVIMMIGNNSNLKCYIQLRSTSLEERNLENKRYSRKVWESTATRIHKLK